DRRRAPATPRAAAVSPRRPVLVVARRDGQASRAGSAGAGVRVGALRGPDAGRHAVRLASGGAGILAHAQTEAAAHALADARARDVRILRRSALPPARRG